MGQIKDEILLEEISKRIKYLRKEKNITQADVYNDTNIHLARIEQGKLNLTVSTLKAICDYLNISLYDFFKGIT